MAIQTVGLLSPGDMGHVVGQVLLQHGMRVVTCLQGRSERTRMLSRKAGIAEVPTHEQLVREADLLLSILVPEEALNTARVVAQALRNAGATTLYADCNAVSPRTVRAIAEVITAAGSRFVDAGIIGSPPRREGTTRFYASGPDVEEFAELGRYGLDVRPLGLEIGQASGIKMCYAAFTKGTTALATGLLTVAHSMGLYEPLVQEFQKSQGDRYRTMERQIPTMPPRAYRWIGEMEEIAQTFADAGLTPKFHQAAADMYRFVASTPLAEETPETRDCERTLTQVIDVLAASLKAQPPA
jgi:3-hydroxyisobutyrate dehydrogenase-like beta-hydroxyacid dehydrogenase